MGERVLTANVKAELTKSNIQIGIFVECIFDGGPLRLWSGIGNFTLLGNVYTGVGSLGGISPIEESADDIRASGVVLTLSGIPSSLISLILTEHFQSRAATVYFAFFNDQWALINDPVMVFSGRMDYPVLEEGGDTAKISVYVESELIDLERPRVRRYTDADQQALFAGDRGLEFVATIQNQDVVWQS